MSEYPIEQRVQAGKVTDYPHPANLPLCMVHGHVRGGLIAIVTTHTDDPLIETIEGMAPCTVCGTIYVLTAR